MQGSSLFLMVTNIGGVTMTRQHLYRMTEQAGIVLLLALALIVLLFSVSRDESFYPSDGGVPVCINKEIGYDNTPEEYEEAEKYCLCLEQQKSVPGFMQRANHQEKAEQHCR